MDWQVPQTVSNRLGEKEPQVQPSTFLRQDECWWQPLEGKVCMMQLTAIWRQFTDMSKALVVMLCGFRCKVVRKGKEGDLIVVPDIVTANVKEAEHLASVLALWHLCKGQVCVY